MSSLGSAVDSDNFIKKKKKKIEEKAHTEKRTIKVKTWDHLTWLGVFAVSIAIFAKSFLFINMAHFSLPFASKFPVNLYVYFIKICNTTNDTYGQSKQSWKIDVCQFWTRVYSHFVWCNFRKRCKCLWMLAMINKNTTSHICNGQN